VTDPQQLKVKLESLAEEYNHQREQHLAKLEPYRRPILVMRAKYASYDIITEILNQHGVHVSVTSIRKFCRRHHSEMERIRAEIEANKVSTAGESQHIVSAMPGPAPTARQSNTPEAAKRGPRIARDTL
jgi:CII-binding regulator of phage lambda lysogenization HflD